MGLFSGITKFIESPFRTGASRAAKDAQKSSNALAGDYRDFIDLMTPSVELGQSFLQGLGETATPDGLNELYTQLSGSDLANNMIGDRQRYAEQAMAGSGLRRSGAAIKTAANLPTEVITGLMDSILGMRQNIASTGLGMSSGILGGLGGIQGANNASATAAMNQASNRSGILGGLISGGASLGGAAMMAGALSDERLKENMTPCGTIADLTVYEWDWKPGVKERLGATMNTGFSAQEVQEKYPQHVIPVQFGGVELLTVDYPELLEELKHAA